MIERELKENTQTGGIWEIFKEGYDEKKKTMKKKKKKMKLPSLKDKSKIKEGERLSSL